jgi:hypothetical protein
MSLKDILKTFKTDQILVPALDRYLISLNDKKPGDGFIHPSGITRCLNETYANMVGAISKDNIDPRLRRIFDNGHYTHRRLQRYLLKAGLLVPSKDKFGEHEFTNKQWRIHGTADGILKAGPRILEIKSMNSRQFMTLQGPKPEHIWQAHLYMWMSNIKESVFLYENKDTQDLKEFLSPFDEETFETIFERVKYVNVCYDSKQRPDRWICGNCEFCERKDY